MAFPDPKKLALFLDIYINIRDPHWRSTKHTVVELVTKKIPALYRYMTSQPDPSDHSLDPDETLRKKICSELKAKFDNLEKMKNEKSKSSAELCDAWIKVFHELSKEANKIRLENNGEETLQFKFLHACRAHGLKQLLSDPNSDEYKRLIEVRNALKKDYDGLMGTINAAKKTGYQPNPSDILRSDELFIQLADLGDLDFITKNHKDKDYLFKGLIFPVLDNKPVLNYDPVTSVQQSINLYIPNCYQFDYDITFLEDPEVAKRISDSDKKTLLSLITNQKPIEEKSDAPKPTAQAGMVSPSLSMSSPNMGSSNMGSSSSSTVNSSTTAVATSSAAPSSSSELMDSTFSLPSSTITASGSSSAAAMSSDTVTTAVAPSSGSESVESKASLPSSTTTILTLVPPTSTTTPLVVASPTTSASASSSAGSGASSSSSSSSASLFSASAPATATTKDDAPEATASRHRKKSGGGRG